MRSKSILNSVLHNRRLFVLGGECGGRARCWVRSSEAHYVEAFREHRVDGALLNVMDEDSLKELGVDSSLERKKVRAGQRLSAQSL